MSDFHNFGATLWITFLYQLCFFLIAYSFEFDYVTDFAGGTNFILLALYTRFYNDYANESVIQNFATFFVCLWGARLSGFLLYRVIVLNEDKRFENIRGSFVKFGAFWLMQMLWVWIVSLPVTYLNSSEFTVTETAFNAGNAIGAVLAFIGIAIEAFADHQKFIFKMQPENKDMWMNEDLWAYSRHPNYFGELLMWWGTFIMCICSATEKIGGNNDEGRHWAWVTIASPLFITALLLGFSGMPLLEAGLNRRHGSKPDFIKYRLVTSPIVMLPQFVYGATPKWIKKWVLFEWDMYAVYLPENEVGLLNSPMKGESSIVGEQVLH